MYKTLGTIYDKFGNLIKAGSIVNESQISYAHLQKLIKRGLLHGCNPKPLKRFEGKIKPCIVTGMWKRPEVFKIFGSHYKKLGIDVIVAGSEGNKSKKLAESFGFIYLEQPNQPLSAKMNSTITEAMKRGYSHVICVGSDDLLTKDLVDEYIRLMREGYDFIGVLDFYFYELETGKASYWGGYRDRARLNHTCGAGRVLSRKLIDSWKGKVWENQHSDYLDNSMQQKLAISNLPKYVFRIKDKDIFSVDVKSDTNMTPFELWDNTSYIDAKIIESRFNVRNSSSNKRN